MKPNYFCGEPLAIGLGCHLLVAPGLVADHWNMKWRYGTPQLCEPPFLLPEAWWEDVQSNATVLYDAEKRVYRMWYLSLNWASYRHRFCGTPDPGPLPAYACVAYAESRDGLSWERPALARHRTPAGEPTNIVFWGQRTAAKGDVVAAPEGAPGRYALIYQDECGPEGICVAWSNNGIDWTPEERNPVLVCACDCANNVVFQPDLGRYVLITRPLPFSSGKYEWVEPKTRHVRRRIAVATSEGLIHWSPIRTVLAPWNNDEPDFDNLRAARYGSAYIGFLNTFTDEHPEGAQCMSGHLVFSHDALHWQRVPGLSAPFLKAGFSSAAFDAGSVCLGKAMIPAGRDHLLLAYDGSTASEGNVLAGRTRLAAVRLRRDGFVACTVDRTGPQKTLIHEFKPDHFAGLRTLPQPGYLLTHEFVVPGPRLTINADCGKGTLRLEAVDAKGVIYPGFSRDECVPITGNSCDAAVCWRETDDLAPLVGKPVAFRFILDEGDLFAFSFESR